MVMLLLLLRLLLLLLVVVVVVIIIIIVVIITMIIIIKTSGTFLSYVFIIKLFQSVAFIFPNIEDYMYTTHKLSFIILTVRFQSFTFNPIIEDGVYSW
ncbi:unnamed protein product [Schistosoma mattheei]|uniref:Uncharacterized protein n=1 Tax=Schistosoma mattheei TaxID=31246 RepID=A0A3P8KYL8_9TREM|nr:unnamed protein product [Schistosoma mattheei]